MSEAKTQCTTCGATILQRTADRNGGLCAPCHAKAAAIPPHGFEVPRDIAERLAALNEDPADFRDMAWRDGADFAHGFINKLEERNKLYQQWFPRLRAFADKCREDQPVPVDESLSMCDRAKQQIFQGKLNHNRPVLGRDKTAAICSMPLLAFPVAQRLWPRDEGRIVLLTPEEERQWDEIYSHPEGSFQWYARFWWIIDDSPEREFSLSEGRPFVWWEEKDMQEGENAWLVKVGQCDGPLAGVGHVELWSWNGTEAKFIKNVSNWIS